MEGNIQNCWFHLTVILISNCRLCIFIVLVRHHVLNWNTHTIFVTFGFVIYCIWCYLPLRYFSFSCFFALFKMEAMLLFQLVLQLVLLLRCYPKSLPAVFSGWRNLFGYSFRTIYLSSENRDMDYRLCYKICKEYFEVTNYVLCTILI